MNEMNNKTSSVKADLAVVRKDTSAFSDEQKKKIQENAFLFSKLERELYQLLFVESLSEERAMGKLNIDRSIFHKRKSNLFARINRILTDKLTENEREEVKVEQIYQEFLESPQSLSKLISKHPEVTSREVRHHIGQRIKQEFGEDATVGSVRNSGKFCTFSPELQARFLSVEKQLKAEGGFECYLTKHPNVKGLFNQTDIKWMKLVFVDNKNPRAFAQEKGFSYQNLCSLREKNIAKMERILTDDLTEEDQEKIKYEQIYREFLDEESRISVLAKKHNIHRDALVPQIRQKLVRDYGEKMTITTYNAAIRKRKGRTPQYGQKKR